MPRAAATSEARSRSWTCSACSTGVLRRRTTASCSCKGHAASALYATLAEAGVLERDEVIAEYCRDGGRYAGHPERHTPGVEATGGSLGHGLAVAAGLALADRTDGSDRRTYCLLGDGELNEGSVWEALALAAHLQLDALRDRRRERPAGPRRRRRGLRVRAARRPLRGLRLACLRRGRPRPLRPRPRALVAAAGRSDRGDRAHGQGLRRRLHGERLPLALPPAAPEDRARTLEALERGRAAA